MARHAFVVAATLALAPTLVACKAKSQSKSAVDRPADVRSAGSAGSAATMTGSEPAGGSAGDGDTGKTTTSTTRPHAHGGGAVVDEVGQIVAEGSLDHSLIRQGIKKRMPDIQKCYEEAVVARPALAGKLVAEFTIRPEGNVATAKATGLDDALARCVARVIEGIRFPKPKNGDPVTVRYPFQFRRLDAGSGGVRGSASGSGSASGNGA